MHFLELLFTFFDDDIENAAENGTKDFNQVMEIAAAEGQIKIVKLCKEFGATNFNWAMENAAENGHIEIVKILMTPWTKSKTRDAMARASENGHIEIVKLLKEWRNL